MRSSTTKKSPNMRVTANWAASAGMIVSLCLIASRANAQFTTLFSFDGTAHGDSPYGSLTLVGSTLYGFAAGGGANLVGTAFSLPVTGGTPTILATFGGTNGNSPEGGLILSGSTFYGVTSSGGGINYDGTVFSLPVSGGTPTTLASFTDTGSEATGNLVLSGSTLYGMTRGGGANGWGTVFSCPVSGGGISTLYSFSSSPGGGASLLLSGSSLYGTTTGGGTYNYGTVFSLPLSGGTATFLTSFASKSTGETPQGSLTLIGSTLYGTTEFGGATGNGSVFSLPVTGGTATTLLSFTGVSGAFPGEMPCGSLILSGETFYGTTYLGGANNDGDVFCINTDGSGYQDLHDFNGTDGKEPDYESLVLNGSTLYGTTYSGGADNDGTVFALTVPEPSTLALLATGVIALAGYSQRRRKKR